MALANLPMISTISVPINQATFASPLNSTAWIPSADRTAGASFQVSLALPNLCAGKPIYLAALALTAGVTSDHQGLAINVRWHAQIGTSRGAWSDAITVIPS